MGSRLNIGVESGSVLTSDTITFSCPQSLCSSITSRKIIYREIHTEREDADTETA